MVTPQTTDHVDANFKAVCRTVENHMITPCMIVHHVREVGTPRWISINKVEEVCPISLHERKNTSVTWKKAKYINRRYSLRKLLCGLSFRKRRVLKWTGFFLWRRIAFPPVLEEYHVIDVRQIHWLRGKIPLTWRQLFCRENANLEKKKTSCNTTLKHYAVTVKYTPLERSSLLICEPVVFFAIYSSWAVVHYYIVHIFPGALSFYELKEGRLQALVRLVFSKTDAVCTYTGRVGSAFEGVKNNDGRNNLSMFPNDHRPQHLLFGVYLQTWADLYLLKIPNKDAHYRYELTSTKVSMSELAFNLGIILKEY